MTLVGFNSHINDQCTYIEPIKNGKSGSSAYLFIIWSNRVFWMKLIGSSFVLQSWKKVLWFGTTGWWTNLLMAYRHCSSSYWTYQKISETMNSFVFQPSWWLWLQLQLQINITKGDVIQNAFWVARPLNFSLLTVVHRDKSLTCQASEFIEKKMNYVFNNFSEALSCWKPSQSIVWLLEQGDVMSGTMSNPALTTQRHCPTSRLGCDISDSIWGRV